MFDILYVSTLLAGLGDLIVVDSRSHSGTPLSVGLLWMSERPVAETSTHNTHKRQTSMPLAVFEPAILGSEQPQAHSLVKLVLYCI